MGQWRNLVYARHLKCRSLRGLWVRIPPGPPVNFTESPAAPRNMKKIYYHKLIRDRIPLKIKKSGGQAQYRILNKKQFEKELIKKVGEESDGLLSAKSKKELVSELADVIEVIEEIKKSKKISSKKITAARKKNMKKKGGFKKRLYLVWSEDTGYRTNERRYIK